MVKKATVEVNNLGPQDSNFMLDLWILPLDVAEKWRFWQAATAPRNLGIKGTIPPKTFRGSSTEVAHGQREQEKTVDSEQEEVEGPRPKERKRPS